MDERKEAQEPKKSAAANEELNESSGFQNASANQGGTTDMDTDALVAGRTSETERGSGLTTKRNVTGSDYDGQTA